MRFVTCLTLFIFLSTPLSAQQWNKAETYQLLNQLHQSGVISKQGVDYFYKSLTTFDHGSYQDYVGIYEQSIHFTSVRDSTQQDTTFSLSLTYLLSQFSFVTKIINQSGINLSLKPGQKTENKAFVQKYESLIGPVWRHSLFSPYKLKSLSDKDQLYKQLQTDCHALNDTLHKYHVLEEKVYQEVKAWIENEFISSTIFTSLFERAFVQSSFYDDYEQSKQKQLAYIDSLHRAEIISTHNLQTLKRSYKPYKLLGPPEVLTYAQRAFVLNFKILPNDNLQALLQVYTMIRDSLLPEFNFIYHKIFDEIVLNEYDKEYKDTFVDFVIDKTSYQQSLSFTPMRVVNRTLNDITTESGLNISNFKIVNDFLADRNSSLRLFVIDDKDEKQLKLGTHISFILMDSLQATALDKAYPIITEIILHSTTFDKKYNRQGLEKMIREYQSIGIIPSLYQDTLKVLLTKMIRDNVNSQERLLRYMSNILTCPDYSASDDDTEELKNKYKTFLLDLQNISRNSFIPTKSIDMKIIKGKHKTSYEYRFTLNGKTYTQKTSDNYSFFWEGKLIQSINQVLKENNVKGAFYQIGYNKYFIFLSPQQYQHLKTAQPELFPELH